MWLNISDMQPDKSPYDFIVSNEQQQKTTPLPRGPSSVMGRALVFGGILFVLLILAIIVMSLLSNDGGSGTSLLKVAQTQQETIRVAELVQKDSASQPVTNASINISLSVTSDQQQLIATAGPAGVSFDEKKLLLGQSPDTDSILEDAKSSGTFSTVSLQVLAAQVAQYQQDLNDSLSKTDKPEIKAVLVTSAANAELLQKQITNTRP